MTIDIPRGYLVMSRENGFLHIYISRNATPWHHSRVSLWGRRKYNKYAKWVDSHCVCDACKSSHTMNNQSQPAHGGEGMEE
jgi:hypothetical protein